MKRELGLRTTLAISGVVFFLRELTRLSGVTDLEPEFVEFMILHHSESVKKRMGSCASNEKTRDDLSVSIKFDNLEGIKGLSNENFC